MQQPNSAVPILDLGFALHGLKKNLSYSVNFIIKKNASFSM